RHVLGGSLSLRACTHNPYPPRVRAFRTQADFGRTIRTPRLCEHRSIFREARAEGSARWRSTKKYQSRASVEGVDALGYYMAPWSYAQLQVLQQAVVATQSLDDAKLGDYIRANTCSRVDRNWG